MNKIVINFTPTGMIPRKNDNSYVPIRPSEIIQDVKEAYELGITMVHLHARDPGTGIPTCKKEVYAEIIFGIRTFAPDLIICVSTSGRVCNDLEARAEVLALKGDVKPDMASLTLGSVNFNKKVSINEPEIITALARKMAEKGIKPELEIFDLGMANYAKYLVKKGFLTLPLYANIILGNIASAQPDLLHIGCLIGDLPSGTIISLGGIGRSQFLINALAVSIGHGVRVGLEDNLWFDSERKKLASNLDLLKRINNVIAANEKKVMLPVELRNLLKLNKGYGVYGC